MLQVGALSFRWARASCVFSPMSESIKIDLGLAWRAAFMASVRVKKCLVRVKYLRSSLDLEISNESLKLSTIKSCAGLNSDERVIATNICNGFVHTKTFGVLGGGGMIMAQKMHSASLGDYLFKLRLRRPMV